MSDLDSIYKHLPAPTHTNVSISIKRSTLDQLDKLVATVQEKKPDHKRISRSSIVTSVLDAALADIKNG